MKEKNRFSRTLFLSIIIMFSVAESFSQGIIEGIITDKKTKEPLLGATVLIEGTSQGASANMDGMYKLTNVPQNKKITLIISFVSYKTKKIENIQLIDNSAFKLDIDLEEAEIVLQDVQIVAQRKTDTEISMLKNTKTSLLVVNGISAQQISKSLDKDAAEIVKRIPGITIQDNRFVVVRGLNQRYNNVWLNNAATPSSETDVKAFSFDAIPGNMIDNMMVFKTGSPELAGEATGGFIKIFTKKIPNEDFFTVEYGIGYNEKTTLKDTYRLPGFALDYIGLGSVNRDIPSNFPENLAKSDVTTRDEYALKLRNKWAAQRYTALPNQKLNINFGKKWKTESGKTFGNITSITYNNSYSSRTGMSNNAYEKLEVETENPIYLYKYSADNYTRDFNIGILHNWAYQTQKGTRIEWQNILNQIGGDKTSNTYGWNNYRQGNFKYYSNQYSSRTTYSTQLNGNHKFNEEKAQLLDWNLGYSYANRIEPDRQNRSEKETSTGNYDYVLPNVASINELGRLYLQNHENLATASINYEQKFNLGKLIPTLKTGIYSEYKTRNFKERSIDYRLSPNNTYDDSFINSLDFETLFTSQYLGQNKVLELAEETNIANQYNASNKLGAAYLALNLPIGKVNIYGGLRGEFNQLILNGYLDVNTPVPVNNRSFNLFPSINISYNYTEKSLVRLAYAKTINRPEFREIAPLIYYDFTEKNSVRGNSSLKDATINNIDIRFEHYPTPSESYSLAVFYKNFKNPIEMVSVGTGSQFSFDNALSAENYGIELEVKKSLETLIGLKNFNLNLNASYIHSQVQFADNLTERARSLQGQSPFVVNTGLYYQNDKAGFASTLMYNVMGKRILVAAQLNQGEVVVPDIYEMPRNVLDFTMNKKMGSHWELKFGIKDILAQNYVTTQTYQYTKNGETKSQVLNNKVYNLGRTWSLGIVWKL